MAAKTLPFAMSRASFQAQIRDLARVSANVRFTAHARVRMRQRGIDDLQVLHVLRAGLVEEGPALDIHGNWKATLAGMAAGERVRVAAALHEGVIVITVY
jgi:Domain of unknown function (DUF4258)